ncbi:MAG: hypothetical protein HYV63_24615 [Candidatus Schekmanbacteria bacterium]|nr:hypothetical protein [Candidatus Schekmanbacteria bacterium]
MTFARNPSQQWHQQAPGSRWFRANLHVQTRADRPGSRATAPVRQEDRAARSVRVMLWLTLPHWIASEAGIPGRPPRKQG